MQQFDLIIVGGGLAGASLAIALRDTPLRVARYGISSVISLVDDMLIEQMHADRKIRQLLRERRSVFNQITELTNRIKQSPLR